MSISSYRHIYNIEMFYLNSLYRYGTLRNYLGRNRDDNECKIGYGAKVG